ncbi:PIN domain-containing protein [Streptomyces sp. NBC_01538]|uniref:PIN domain-containing protein n=1 Tax=Streptomyces sp. NBC_01538 TaxID=2903897 RepID=UPI00386B9E50
MCSSVSGRPRPLELHRGFRLGVFDTSVLTSDITAALKRGKPSSILAGMRYGTLRGFIPHYVWAEVPRVLADRKDEGGNFDLVAAERLWWEEYVPLLHVVCVNGLPMSVAADRLAQEDLSDVGILQLADVLAPVVLLAADRDLIRLDVAARDWPALRAVLG